MNKKRAFKLFSILIWFCFLLAACSKDDIDAIDAIDEDIFNREGGNIKQQVQIDYEFPFGPKNIERPVKISESKLEYDMDIDNRGSAAEFGVMIIIDGIPQKTALGNDCAIMHKISLDTNEYENYKFVIDEKDLKINDGDNHIIYPMIILEPDYIPEGKNHFVHEGKLSACKGLQFTYSVNKNKEFKTGSVESVKIDNRFRAEYRLNKDSGLENQILWSLDDSSNAFITSRDLERGFDINLIGDELGEMRVFMFVNNEPIEINGYNFYDVEIQKGMVSKIDVEPNEEFISELSNGDSIFLIAMPKNLESVGAWPYKTRTKIVRDINYE
ncbi:MAG TPA: hypothetical protein VFC70_01975 [Oscillospiraceae bacterium]|nr:hypothetical protein [Oscillospiraceae bacterium]